MISRPLDVQSQPCIVSALNQAGFLILPGQLCRIPTDHASYAILDCSPRDILGKSKEEV